MITNIQYVYRIYSQIMCTNYTLKTQTCVVIPIRTDRVGDDGVGVSASGGRGGHDSSTSTS